MPSPETPACPSFCPASSATKVKKEFSHVFRFLLSETWNIHPLLFISYAWSKKTDGQPFSKIWMRRDFFELELLLPTVKSVPAFSFQCDTNGPMTVENGPKYLFQHWYIFSCFFFLENKKKQLLTVTTLCNWLRGCNVLMNVDESKIPHAAELQEEQNPINQSQSYK